MQRALRSAITAPPSRIIRVRRHDSGVITPERISASRSTPGPTIRTWVDRIIGPERRVELTLTTGRMPLAATFPILRAHATSPEALRITALFEGVRTTSPDQEARIISLDYEGRITSPDNEGRITSPDHGGRITSTEEDHTTAASACPAITRLVISLCEDRRTSLVRAPTTSLGTVALTTTCPPARISLAHRDRRISPQGNPISLTAEAHTISRRWGRTTHAEDRIMPC
jgi:hypothetical protein